MSAFTLTKLPCEGNTEYGIRIESADYGIREYPCVSTDKSETEKLIHRLDTGDVSPLHFDDIVRDYILELAYERMKRNHL